MIIKKRQLVMSTLIVALGAAVFVNWYYTRPDTQPAIENEPTSRSASVADDTDNLGEAKYVNSQKSEYFSAAEMKRKSAHEKAMEVLNKTIKDSSATPEAVKKASEELAELAKAIKLEADIESLITAKTGKDCVVLINDGKTEIIAEKGAVNSASILQITEIVMKQTGLTADDITIIELNS